MSDDPRQNLPPQVVDALAKGNFIAAIKYLRQHQPTLGLAEAKALVEAIQRQQGGNVKMNVKTAVKAAASQGMHQHSPPQSPPHSPPHAAMTPSMDPHISPGEVPRTSSGAAFAMVVIAIVVVIAAAVYFGN
jgi:hypothetical protein